MEPLGGNALPFSYPHGWPEVVYGTQPAAGGGFSLTNPGRIGWLLLGVTFRLVTDANAANRFVRVEADDGSGTIYSRNGFAQAVTAGTTAFFTFQGSRGSSDWNANNEAYLPLQPLLFAPGHKLLISIAGVQAGDQLSQIALMFERFPDFPEAFDPMLRRQ